jgi:transposase
MIAELSVGIDYHSELLQVCIVDPSGRVVANRRIANDIGELFRVIQGEGKSVAITAEACNGSAALLDAVRKQTDWQVRLCHPGYAQRMRSNPDKTDKSDGELIADLTRIGYVPEVWLAPSELRDLRALVRYRALQMAEARSVKLRIRSLLRNNRIVTPSAFNLWTKAGYAWLSGETGLTKHSAWVMSRYLCELQQLLEAVKKATERLTSFVKHDTIARKLLAHRGIGVVTAAVMRAEIGTFRRFKTGKQLARFCGLSPCNRSSGNVMATSGMIHAGNPLLKACIAQGVWTLIRYDKHWNIFAQRLLDRGKAKGIVAGAVANRWIRKLFHELKNY